MSIGDVSLACATALVDELVRGGVEHACLSPGSRSTPLALALARHPGITVHVHLDERSSAFFALGLAKAQRRPVAVACTSGTAAAELFPAVVEASQSRVPLVLLTADRPPSLRGTGANQTIDQVELYGRYARAYLEPPLPDDSERVDEWADTGRTAVAASLGPLPGPVHVNSPFDEPLIPEGVIDPTPQPGRRAIAATMEPAPRLDVEALVRELSGGRGLVLVGPMAEPPMSVLILADSLGWPVVAEPMSGARRPGFALAAGQALLGDADWIARHLPEVVLQIGAAPTTRASQRLSASAGRLIVIDRDHPDPDPARRATLRVSADADGVAERLLELRPEPADPAWARTWWDADRVGTLDDLMDRWDEPFEPRLARDLGAAVPDGSFLVAGNSSPIRDLDLAMMPREGVRVLGNRGASGIDGMVSTALGVATAAPGATFALLGDLSFLYDAGAMLWSGRSGPAAVLVVISNGGGQIFSLLPQRELPEFAELFVTPHPARIEDVCRAAGCGYVAVRTARDLKPAVERSAAAGGVELVEVVVDPELNRERRNELRGAVASALGGSS